MPKLDNLAISIATVLLLFSVNCRDKPGNNSKSFGPVESVHYSDFSAPEVSYSKPDNSTKNTTDKNNQSMKHLQPALDVLKKHLLPILQDIQSRPVHCDSIIDDPQALNDYQSIRNRNNVTKASQFFDEEMMKSIERETFTAEMEERLQQRTEGQITYAFPNASTVRALAQIHQKYPCAEASVIALMNIWNIIWQPGHLYINEEISWLRLETEFLQYIISNYPNTWEAEFVKYLVEIHKPIDDLKRIDLNKAIIKYTEENGILSDKYFTLYINRTDPDRNFVVDLYGQNAQKYFFLGMTAGKQSLKKSGKLSKESIDLCEKGFDTFNEAINKYPDARNLRYTTKGYYLSPDHKLPSVLGAETCYNMIHRLGRYQGK